MSSNHHHKDEARLLLIEKVLLLKSLSIFSETPETVLAEVAELLEEVDFENGHIIFEEGDVGNCMYIIFKGEVKIYKGSHQLAILTENNLFGELALLDTETRSASVAAHTDVLLLKLDQEPFYDLMENRVEVAKGIIATLCKRIRTLNAQLQAKG
jgi:CRP-like cAMP-binding protein